MGHQGTGDIVRLLATLTLLTWVAEGVLLLGVVLLLLLGIGWIIGALCRWARR